MTLDVVVAIALESKAVEVVIPVEGFAKQDAAIVAVVASCRKAHADGKGAIRHLHAGRRPEIGIGGLDHHLVFAAHVSQSMFCIILNRPTAVIVAEVIGPRWCAGSNV